MEKERKIGKIIGTAELDIEQFRKFRQEEAEKYEKREPNWVGAEWRSYFFNNQDLARYAESIYYGGSGLIRKPDQSADEKIEKYEKYIKDNGLSWELLYENEHIVILQFAEFSFGIPPYLAKTKLYENYNALSIGQLRNLSGAARENAIVPMSDISMDDINHQADVKRAAIEDAKAEYDLECKKMKEELEKIKREIEARHAEKLQEIEAKKAELNKQLDNLNKQVFLLETEIYGIRCFLGETVKFIQLRKGRGTIETEPVVLFQKIRYLDEEMGKLLAIYDFNWADVETFEAALKVRDDLFELFVPGPKSISLVRLCHHSIKCDRSSASAGILDEYKVYHGKRIAIMIRDGENLWMGWTEEERININEDMFFQNKVAEYQNVDDMPAGRTSTKEDIASRYFVFSILQGVLKNGALLKLPPEASVFHANQYVIFSAADGWLEDNRFGNFADIIERTNKQPLSKGDMILTTLRITRDDAGYSPFRSRSTVNDAYNNDRGRGDKNRTHDVSLPDQTVLPINCVDIVENYEIYAKRYKCKVTEVVDREDKLPGGGVSKRIHHEFEKTDEFIKETVDTFYLENGYLYGNKRYTVFDARYVKDEDMYQWYIDLANKQWGKYERCYLELSHGADKESGFYDVPYKLVHKNTERHCFVSGVKRFSENSRANMEVYSDEYLNLTYLNSVYVLYAIQNRKIGGWVSGRNRFDYASSIPYLNKALEYLRKREKEEAAMLEKYMELYPDWQVDLSEWRMKHQYHRLTEKRAKKFATDKKKEGKKV